MALQILLADDHAILRHSLRAILQREGFEVVAEAQDGREAVTQAAQFRPDVAVLDVAMPQLNGLDAAGEISRVSPRTRTVLLTMHGEEPYVVQALERGVKGYVLKSQGSPDLIRAIREVASGRTYLSPGVSEAVVDAWRERRGQKDPLTARERQVLQLVAEGHSTKEVAALLGVSVKTAETHRTRLMKKLGVHETASLVRYAIRRGIVQP